MYCICNFQINFIIYCPPTFGPLHILIYCIYIYIYLFNKPQPWPVLFCFRYYEGLFSKIHPLVIPKQNETDCNSLRCYISFLSKCIQGILRLARENKNIKSKTDYSAKLNLLSCIQKPT